MRWENRMQAINILNGVKNNIFQSDFCKNSQLDNASFMLVNASLHLLSAYIPFCNLLRNSFSRGCQTFCCFLFCSKFSFFPFVTSKRGSVQWMQRNEKECEFAAVSGSRRVVNVVTNPCESVVFLRSTLVIKNY